MSDGLGGDEANTWMNVFTSFGIHIILIIVVIILKWQYDRNRYRYPKGPRDWRNIGDAISYHRKKRENLLSLAADYPESCTVMTHTGRLVLLNDLQIIKEIFVERADLVSNKIDGYIENQLRYKEGKHVRTGIVFRHYDHNARIIHKALVYYFENNLIGKRFNSIVNEQIKNIRLSNKFDVTHTTFSFAARLLTSFSCSSVSTSIDDQTYTLFEQNLYKISKAVYSDTFAKSAKAVITQITGLSETLDINKNVLDYVKTWIKYRTNDSNQSTKTNQEEKVTSTIKIDHDFLDSILNITHESSPHLDEDDIASCLLDIIMHGSEMLKSALSWILLYIVNYAEETDTCRREVRNARFATFDLSSAETLVYTQAFVKEVLRLSPVVPVVIHSTLQDFKWRGFHFQKRTQFGANILGLHYSSKWNNPNEFDVKRWLAKNPSSIPMDHYAPFGFGPRSCIAEKYIINLLTGILGILLYHNDFEKVGQLPDPKQGTFGLANLPPKYSLKATAFHTTS